MYRLNETPITDKEVQTSELDELCLDILEVLLGERKFSDFNLPLLLDTLEKIQEPVLHEIVSQRWAVISNLYCQELEAALKTIEKIFDTYSNNTAVPKWIINDVLIDWRNIQIVDDETRNIYTFSVQEKINTRSLQRAIPPRYTKLSVHQCLVKINHLW